MRLLRLAAYFALLTLVLHLGDWPFVDEILAAEGYSQVAAARFAASPDPASPGSKAKEAARGSSSLYLSLTNLVDMPHHVMPLPANAEATYGRAAHAERFRTRCGERFYRPPISAS